MALVLPAAVWLAVFLAWLGPEKPAREAALVAFTAVSLAVLLFSDLLSPFRALRFEWLVALWAAVLLVIAVAFRTQIAEGVVHFGAALRTDRGGWQRLGAVVLLAFAAGTLLSALLYPIVNSDSLTYHMPRVFFWFQNHSTARYPTPEGRQLFSSPFAEYLILHLKILAGGTDRLSNTAQWLSYVFSVLAGSLVALRLRAGKMGQLAAAIAVAATPMALLQASSTQNDLTAAMWCLASVYWILSYVVRRPAGAVQTRWWILWAAVSLALAIQTKPTAYLVCAPFLIWLAVVAIRRDGLRTAAFSATAVAAIVLVLMSGWYVRNAQLLNGDPIGVTAPGGNANLLIRDWNPSSVATNALKNASMMLGTPSTAANSAIAKGVRAVIALYRGDPDNPRTMDANMPSRYQLDYRISYHDVGPSPIIALLVAVSAVIVFSSGGAAIQISKWYLLPAGLAFLLATGLVGYSYYVNRTQLAALLVLVPLIGVALDPPTGARVRTWLLVGLLGIAVFWGAAAMLFNSTNRLLPPSLTPVRIGNRDLGYWNTSYEDLGFLEHAPQFQEPYETIAGIVQRKAVRRVGIDSEALNVPIYPLLHLLEDRQVAYVGNTLFKNKVSNPRFSPQAVVEIVPADQYSAVPDPGVHVGPILYGPVYVANLVIVLREGQ